MRSTVQRAGRSGDGCRSESRGLREQGLPKLGGIYQLIGDVFYAGVCDETAWLITGEERKRTWVSTTVPPRRLRLAVSRSHRHSMIDASKARLGDVEEIACGSVGAKISLLVSGQADAYVEPAPYTSKWDVCGAEAILGGAGGFVSDTAGGPMCYDERDIKNKRGFVATSRVCHGDVLAEIPISFATSNGAPELSDTPYS